MKEQEALTAARRGPHYAWYILAACCCIQFGGCGIMQNTLGIFMPPTCRELGFTTAHRILHEEERDVIDFPVLAEKNINLMFRAAAGAVEEAIISSMLHAETVTGRAGHRRLSLAGLLKEELPAWE